MQSSATTVAQYLATLPPDRRAAIAAVRKIILDNLDSGFEEGMQYGMIGYYVPHRIYPAGYHCDPSQPLGFAGLASQKNHMALYLMCLYGSEARKKAFAAAWAKAGKKLDMGKSCLRFKKLEDLALDVIADHFRSITAVGYIAAVEKVIGTRSTKTAAAKAKESPQGKSQGKVSGKSKRITKATTKRRPR